MGCLGALWVTVMAVVFSALAVSYAFALGGALAGLGALAVVVALLAAVVSRL